MNEQARQEPDLCQTIEKKRQKALELGVLQPIETQRTFVDDGGLTFELRKISSITSKQTARNAQKKDPDFNPFARPDPALRVIDFPPAHRVLLNKFPVFSQHILLITKRFSEQTAPLYSSDFEVLSQILTTTGGLAFYNAGPQAGASQKHKHLQIIPQQSLQQNQSEQPHCCALEQLWAGQKNGSLRFKQFDFPHSAQAFDHEMQTLWAHAQHPRDLDALLFVYYLKALTHLEMNPDIPGPYNLCITRQGLLLIPRKQDEVAGISLNALAYAGFFLARDDEELTIIRDYGPLNMLRDAVGVVRPDRDF